MVEPCGATHNMKDGNPDGLLEYTYVGRPSRWGNPYKVRRHDSGIAAALTGKGHSREVALSLYEQYLRASPELMADLPHLHGLMLSCHCFPLPCHADVLRRVACELVHGS